MKASELIVKLQGMIATTGDEEVYASDNEDGPYIIEKVVRSNKADTLWAQEGFSAAHAEADAELRKVQDGILLE